MDIKERTLLNYYYGKLLDNTVDEKDIYTILLMIGNRSSEISCIKELAAFAVQRERYRGIIRDYLFDTRIKFKTPGRIRIEDVFSFKEMKTGINKSLADHQFKGLTNEKMNDFVACLISILQQIRIIDDQDSEVGKLFFAISSKQIILMAEIEVSQNFLKKTNAVFPVLTANNTYVVMKKQDRYDTPYLFKDKVIEVINREGKLEITIPE